MKPTEASLCCINTDGHKALIATDSAGEKALSRIEQGELIGVTLQPVKSQRSIQQLRLYWAAAELTAEIVGEYDEAWNTKERVVHNCKIIVDHVKDRYRINRKLPDGTREEYEMMIPDSISFANCDHLSACGVFTRSFEIMAKKCRITVEQLLDETRARMKGIA